MTQREIQRLQAMVATMLAHGNTARSLNLARLASYNTWTSEDEIAAEFSRQEHLLSLKPSEEVTDE